METLVNRQEPRQQAWQEQEAESSYPSPILRDGSQILPPQWHIFFTNAIPPKLHIQHHQLWTKCSDAADNRNISYSNHGRVLCIKGLCLFRSSSPYLPATLSSANNTVGSALLYNIFQVTQKILLHTHVNSYFMFSSLVFEG